MYNPLLDTFIAVSDCGSFTKAAETLYISPTAVMKQMNFRHQLVHTYKFYLMSFFSSCFSVFHRHIHYAVY